jgi:hypothetical protein
VGLVTRVFTLNRRRASAVVTGISSRPFSSVMTDGGAYCLRDLGRAADAARYASRSVVTDAGAGFVRSDFFATMVLADAYLAAGDLEQACATALRALTAGALIRSGRCVNYLRDFRKQLTRAADATAVTDFNEQARESRLWQIASRPDKTAA